MAKAFNLTAQINLRGPSNLRPIVADIKRQLGSVSANVNVKVSSGSARSIDNITSRLRTMNVVLAESQNRVTAINQAFSSLTGSVSRVQSATRGLSTNVNGANQSLRQTSKAIQVARTEMEEFGKQSYLAIKRFAAFSFVTSGIFALTNAVTSGFKAFLSFDRELIRLQQVSGKSAMGVQMLANQITTLSTSLGVSSEKLMTVATTLAQAGFSVKDTTTALQALAKTDLAPSFDDLTETTEGAIAAMRQFGLQAKDLEASLGSINAVAAAFAVESSDIITAIQRTGGVFAAASKGVTEGKDALNEFIAVFTSIRATTRESAETIATGLRTIFTRIQRAKTIEQLKEFGVNLQDLEGKFVGPYEAVRRLSAALNSLDPRDVRFSTIVEELGGFRQIGKVIPLIQQFATAQQALGVAQRGQNSLTDAQVAAQQSLVVQLAKVREQFLALIRDIGKSTAFQGLFKVVLGLASGLISLASAFKPILPILAIFGAIKGASALTQFGRGFFGSIKKGGGAGGVGSNLGSTLSGNKEKERTDATNRASDAIRANTAALNQLTAAVRSLTSRIGGGSGLNSGGVVGKFATGGLVPGSGNSDTYKAMLTPGEFVIRKKAVETIGADNLHQMNKYALGGKVKLTGKQLSETYASLKNRVDPDQEYSAVVSPIPQSTKSIQPRMQNIRKQKPDYPNWKLFEYAVAEKYGLKLAGGNKFLDYPSVRGEAKFLPPNATYGSDRETGFIKGNNNETMLAKLVGSGQYRYGATIRDYYPANINNFRKFARGGLIQYFMGGSPGAQGVQPSSINLTSQSILDKLTQAGGSRRARELLSLDRIKQAISRVQTTGKRPQASNVFDKRFLQSSDAVPFLPTLSDLVDEAIASFAGTSASDFKLTPEQIANAREVAIAGLQSDMKDLSSYYRLRKGVPLHVHTGIISPDKYSIINKLLEKQHTAQVEAARELAPNANITPLKKEDRQKFGEANLGGYNLETILALFGSGNGKKTTQDAIDFASGLTPLAASVFGVPAGIPTQAKLTVSSSNVTKALDGIIKTFAFGGKADGPKLEDISKQIMDKYPEIQFRISKRKSGFGYNLLGALKSDGGLLNSKGLKFEQPSNLQKLLTASDKMAEHLMKPKGFASGGSSEDTVQALLTPGEFVINKNAAKRIGYAKLNQLNKADKLQGYNKGGFVGGVQKFLTGGDVIGPRGQELQDKRFLLAGKLAQRKELEQKREAASDPEEKKKLTGEMQGLTKEIDSLGTEISHIENEFKELGDDIEAFKLDAIDAAKALREAISSELESVTGKKPSAAKVEEVEREAIRRGGKVKTDKGVMDFTSRTRDLVNAQNNLGSRTQERIDKFGIAKKEEDFNVPVQGFVAQKQTQLEQAKKQKSELESKASTATGTEKILLTNQIKQSAQKIDELNQMIEGASQAYSAAVTEVDSASKEEAAASARVEAAEQAMVDALRKRAKDFDKLSPKRQKEVVEEVMRTGQVKDKSGKTQSFGPEFEELQQSELALDAAQKKKKSAEEAKEILSPTPGPFDFSNPANKAKQQKFADDEFIRYKAQQSGTSESAVKRDLAQQIGKRTYENQEFYGARVTEAKSSLVTRRDTAMKIGGSIKNAQAALEAANASGNKDAAAAAATQLADAQSRLATETEGILQQMIALRPDLAATDEGMAALAEGAKQVANDLSTGNLEAAQQSMGSAVGTSLTPEQAKDLAVRQTAKENNIDEGLLRRQFGSGKGAKMLERQQFAQSREGQRFGMLSEIAPDMLSKFSKSKAGQLFGKVSDFTSGKGGVLSKGFAKFGGFAGLGSAAAVGIDTIKQFMPKSTMSNPKVAGAFGAASGAASGAAMGSFAGAPGAIVGAIVGGINGWFRAKNAAVLQNAVEKVAKSAGDLDEAFKKLETNANDTNFKEVQKAFGDMMSSSKPFESIAMGESASLTGSATSGAALGSAALGAAIGTAIAPGIGTAIGGVLGYVGGGIADYVTKPSEAEKQEAVTNMVGSSQQRTQAVSRMVSYKLGRSSSEDLDTMGVGELGPTVQAYADSAIEAASRTKNLTAAQKETIRAESAQQAALDAYTQKRKQAGATDEQIAKELSTSKGQKKAIQEGMAAIKVQDEAAKKQAQLALATKQVAIATENLIDIYRRVIANAERYGSELDQFESDLGNVLGDLGGNATMGNVNRQNEAVLKNPSAYSMQEVMSAANGTAGMLGNTPEAKSLASNAGASKILQDQLPAMLRNAKTQDQRESAVGQIRQMFSDNGLESGAINEIMTDIEEKIKQGGKEGQDTGTLIDEIQPHLDAFSKKNDAGMQALQAAQKQYNDTLQKARNIQNQYNQAILQSNKYLRQASQIRMNAELQLKEAFGQETSLQEMNKPFDAEVSSMTSGLVGRGFLGAGESTDPFAIAQSITAASQRNQELEEQSPKLFEAGKNLPEGEAGNAQREALNQAQLDNIQAMGANKVAIDEGRQALEKLANDGSKAANALKKIQDEQRRIEGLGNRFEKIFTSGPEELFNMDRQSAALQAAQVAGSDMFKSRRFRQDAFAGLEQDKEFLTNDEYRKQKAMLMRKSFESQGLGGNSMINKGGINMTVDEFLKRIEKGGPGDEDPNVKAYREATETQAKANEALALLNREQAAHIEKAMLNLEDFLSTKFPNILTDAVVKAKEASQTKPENKPEEKPKTEKQNAVTEAKSELEARKKEEDSLRDKETKAKEAAGGWMPERGASVTAKQAENKRREATAARKAAEDKVKAAEAAAQQEQEATDAKAKAEADKQASDKREADKQGKPTEVQSVLDRNAELRRSPDLQRRIDEQEARRRGIVQDKAKAKLREMEAQQQSSGGSTAQTSASTEAQTSAATQTQTTTQAQVTVPASTTTAPTPTTPYEERQASRREAYLSDKEARRQNYLADKETRKASYRPKGYAYIEKLKAERAARNAKQTERRQAEMARNQEAWGEGPDLSNAPGLEIFGPDPDAGMENGAAQTEVAARNTEQQTPTGNRWVAAEAAVAQVAANPGAITAALSGSNASSMLNTSPNNLTPQDPNNLLRPRPSTSTPTGQPATPATGGMSASAITLDPSSLEGLNTFNATFGSYVDKLVNFQFPVIPDKIELTGNYTLDVQITGAAALEGLSKEMKKLVTDLVEPKLAALRNEVSAKTGGAVKPSAAMGTKK